MSVTQASPNETKARRHTRPLWTGLPFIGYDPASVLSRHAWETLEGDVRIDDRIRKSVVFIGHRAKGPFIAHGTGFVGISFIGDAGFQNVITARHVIDGIKSDIVHVRVNRLDGKAQTIEAPKDWWHFHQNEEIDVAVCPTGLPTDQFDILHLPLEGNLIPTARGLQQGEIGIGDDVFVAGMFIGRLGETKNLPIVRGGIISAMPEEKIKTSYGYHDAYLIETRSIDGLSGSPIFAFRPIGLQVGGHPEASYVYRLIGMLLGHNQVINPGDTIEIMQTSPRRSKSTKEALIPLNTGIGIVLPISEVIAAVDQPKLRAQREKTLQEHLKNSRFVPDSAVKSGPPIMADNPQHKEDFSSLVAAAARKKRPADQT